MGLNYKRQGQGIKITLRLNSYIYEHTWIPNIISFFPDRQQTLSISYIHPIEYMIITMFFFQN